MVTGSIPLQRFWTNGHPYHPYLFKTGETKREDRQGYGSRGWDGRHKKPLVRRLGVAGVARLVDPFQCKRFADHP